MDSGRPSQLVFVKFFEETKESFTRFAYTYVKDWDAADDIFMESIAQCWQAYTDSPTVVTKPYLLSVVRNRALNYLRNEASHYDIQGRMYDHQVREIGLRISSLEACNPSALFTSEIERIVQETLKQMPELTRQIFSMSRYDNRSNPEIAQDLSLSVKAVEYHITKALRMLRRNLKDYLCFILLFNDYWRKFLS